MWTILKKVQTEPYINNPLTFKIEEINELKKDKEKNKPEENQSGDYKSCNEIVNGWEGNISNIHKIETSSEIKIKWEYLNNEYGIVIYEGKGEQ